METNRIDFTPAWSTKNTNAKTNTAVAGGFADLLFNAMSQKNGVAPISQTHFRPTEATTPRRRFDDHPVQPTDFRDKGSSHTDCRVDNENSRSPWRDSAADDYLGQGPEVRSSHVGESCRSKGCGAKPGQDVPSDEPPSTEMEATEDAETSGETLAADDAEVSGDESELTGNTDSDDGSNSNEATAETAIALATDGSAQIPAITEVVKIAETASATPTESESETGDVPELVETAAPAELTEALIDPAMASLTSAPGDAGDEVTSSNSTAAVDGTTAPINEDSGDSARIEGFASVLTQAENAQEDPGADDAQARNFLRNSERSSEGPISLSRRQAGGNRHQPGSETASGGMGQQPAGPTSEIRPAGEGTSPARSSAGFGTVSFDPNSGTLTGMPGWNLHLAQGSSLKRAEFVANLRQHLQNLPAHEQVALSIQRSIRDGAGSITLQLSPSELGRIHLKLEIDDEKNVQANISVERPATLELLQRDSKALERALQDAGLKAGPGDLSFSLQGGDPEAFARDFGSGSGAGSGNGNGTNDGTEAATAEEKPASVIATADGYVDVQV